jgi:hypothetical protein
MMAENWRLDAHQRSGQALLQGEVERLRATVKGLEQALFEMSNVVSKLYEQQWKYEAEHLYTKPREVLAT